MIYLLLVLYQIKHFVCDYPLQGRYMLGKFKGGNEWILPLAAHAGVHGVATFLIALCYKPRSAFWIALLDMAIHFTMDRIKASPNLLGRYKALSGAEYVELLKQKDAVCQEPFDIADKEKFVASCDLVVPKLKEIENKFRSNVYFWWALGLDQGVHHLTHYVIIWFLLR